MTPTYVTNQSILVNVPSSAPAEVTNQLRLVFKDGSELTHDFFIEISAPALVAMQNEYTPEGETTTIVGDFFFDPVIVTFNGGVEAEVKSVDQTELTLIVPEGAEPGPITVETNFGEAVSSFWYHDNRFVFGNMDTPTDGWWHGQNYLDPVPEISQIDNNYVYIDQELGVDAWFEYYVGDGEGILEGTRNIPNDAILNPSAFDLKFEINTLSPLPAGVAFRYYIGNDMGSERNDNNFRWDLTEEIDTGGEWQTITLELSDIINANPNISVNPEGYQLSFWLWQNTVAFTAQFAVDNFRVSPK